MKILIPRDNILINQTLKLNNTMQYMQWQCYLQHAISKLWEIPFRVSRFMKARQTELKTSVVMGVNHYSFKVRYAFGTIPALSA